MTINQEIIVIVQEIINDAIVELERIKPKKVEQQEALTMAKEELDVYTKLTLFELQRAFEE